VASRVGGAQEEQWEVAVQSEVAARSHQAVSEATAAAERAAAMGATTEVMSAVAQVAATMAEAEAAQAVVWQAEKDAKAELMGLEAESVEDGASEVAHGVAAAAAWVRTAGGQTEQAGSAEPMEAVTRVKAMDAAEVRGEADSGAAQMVEVKVEALVGGDAEVPTEQALVARLAVAG
jgi:hypothetical protein